MKKSNGYYLAVGGNEETELVLKLDYNDNIRTAGTAITKLTIPKLTTRSCFRKRKDSNVGLNKMDRYLLKVFLEDIRSF